MKVHCIHDGFFIYRGKVKLVEQFSVIGIALTSIYFKIF